jgi:hypothetical protein
MIVKFRAEKSPPEFTQTPKRNEKKIFDILTDSESNPMQKLQIWLAYFQRMNRMYSEVRSEDTSC